MNQAVKFRYTFPIAKSEQRSDGNYIIGYASGPEVDSEKERMAPEAIQAFSDQINSSSVDHRLVYRDAHAPDGVLRDLGEITKAWINEKMHLGIEVKLDMENPAATYLWKQINEKGKQYGMSVAGRVYDYIDEFVSEIGSVVRTYKSIMLDEISNTTRPAWYPSFGSVLAKSIKDAESDPSNDDQPVVQRVGNKVSDTAATADMGENTLSDEELLDATVKDDEAKSAADTGTDEKVTKWSSAASDASSAAYVLSNLLSLLGGETDPEDASDAEKIRVAIAAIQEYITSESAEIGTPEDAQDSLYRSDTETLDDGVEKTDTEETTEGPDATVETDETEKSEEDETDVEKAGKKVSAETAKVIIGMHTKLKETMTHMEDAMGNLGILDGNASLSSTKSASEEVEDTIDKSTEAEPVDELATLKAQVDDLAKANEKATARIEELENSPNTVLPGLITDETKKAAEDDFTSLLEKASPSEKLRLAFAAHSGGR